MILLGLATLAGLWAPDVDLAVQRWLRHRSVVTHAALLPFLAATLPGEAGPGLAVGLGIGMAVHLACDALSPMKGFALIRFPWPWRGGLGTRSRAWLLVHAGLSAAVAAWALPLEAWRPVAGAAAVLSALLYGLGRERSVGKAAVALLALGLGGALGTVIGRA